MITLNTIFKICMESETAALQLKNGLSSHLVVADPFKRRVGEFVADFVDQYGKTPDEGDLSAFISSLESQKQKTGVKKALREIQEEDVSGYTPEYIAEEAVETFRQMAAENAASMLKSGEVTPEAWQEFHEEIQGIEPVSLGDVADLRDVETWLRPQKREERIKTGIEGLDRIIGGWGRGELSFLLADTGIGKSISLNNFGYTAAFYGQRVLHITLELGQRQAALRFYRRVTERDRQEIQNIKAAREEAKRWWRFAIEGGDYHLGYWEPYTQTAEDIRAIMDLFQKQNGSIDVLILDYLDLMSPSKGEGRLRRYEQLGRISHRIRGMAQENDFTVLSATQAKRPQGKEYEDLRLSDMGDSYEKVRAADIVIGFVRTEEEEKHYQGRYQILKVREAGKGGGEVPLLVDLDRMMIADLDSPDGRRVAQELDVAPRPLDPERR